MTVAVLGGTGRTGRLVVAELLKADHRVRVLARDTKKIPPVYGLELIEGDATDNGRVMGTMVGCKLVIILLSADPAGPMDICSQGTQVVLQAMRLVGNMKIIIISSLGVGESRRDLPWFFRIYSHFFLKEVLQDKEKQEALIKASYLDWTIIRPTSLVDEPTPEPAFSGPGRVAESLPPGRKPRGKVSRADVAALVMKAITDPSSVQATWFITA